MWIGRQWNPVDIRMISIVPYDIGMETLITYRQKYVDIHEKKSTNIKYKLTVVMA